MMTRRWWFLALTLAIACGPAAVAAGPVPLSNADAALAQLAKDLADSSQPLAQRLEVVRVLGGWGGPNVRAPLIAALKDPAPELRAAAARALAWPGNREAIDALRERLEAPDEVRQVKGAAAEALGYIGDPATRGLLLGLTKHPEAEVRQAAIWSVSLGPLADPADRVPYLIQLAEDQAFLGLVRCDAIRALFTVNEDRVVQAFLRILENEPRFALSLPEGPGTQQKIMELRRVQARDVAAWVAEGLGQLKAKNAVAPLLKSAEDRSDYFLRLMSLRALIVLNVPEAAPVFVKRLEDEVPENRILALMGLGALKDRAVVPPVARRLTDGSPLVRAQAVTTLAMLGDASVRPALEEMQKREPESNVQSALEEALAHLPR
jgi:HEAT repeat protein